MIRGLKKNSIILLILLTLFPLGCDPPDPAIFYPGTGSFGENLLRSNPPLISMNKRYSLSVEIRGEVMVRIAIPNSSQWDFSFDPPPIGWNIMTNGNWTVFSAKGEGSYDCEIFFKQLPVEDTFRTEDPFKIKVYEHDSITPRVISFD